MNVSPNLCKHSLVLSDAIAERLIALIECEEDDKNIEHKSVRAIIIEDVSFSPIHQVLRLAISLDYINTTCCLAVNRYFKE